MDYGTEEQEAPSSQPGAVKMLAREKRKKKRGGHGPHQKQPTKNHPNTRGWSESNQRRNRAEIMSHFVIHDHQQGGSPAAPKHKAHFFSEKAPRPPVGEWRGEARVRRRPRGAARGAPAAARHSAATENRADFARAAGTARVAC